MRVGNIHRQQTGVDVTKIPTVRHTRAFRRHVDVMTTQRIRYVDDNGGEQETPDNTADDEDDHIDEQKRRKMSISRTRHD